jgi:regulator of sirC expression with transglutaminase-like and TPR domain
MEDVGILSKIASFCETLDPRVSGSNLLKRIAFVGHELDHRIRPDMDSKEKLSIITNYFFEELQFVCSPDNIFLPTVLQTKRGSPLSLGMVYRELAKKYGLDIKHIVYPNHRLLKWVRNDECLYIDLQDQGHMLNSSEIIVFLKNMATQTQDKILENLSDEEVFVSYVTKLKEYYIKNNFIELALKSYDKILQIRPNSFSVIKERALLYYNMGKNHEALSDLKRYFSFSNPDKVSIDLLELYSRLAKNKNEMGDHYHQ